MQIKMFRDFQRIYHWTLIQSECDERILLVSLLRIIPNACSIGRGTDEMLILTGDSRHQLQGSQHAHRPQRPQVKVGAHRSQDSVGRAAEAAVREPASLSHDQTLSARRLHKVTLTKSELLSLSTSKKKGKKDAGMTAATVIITESI